jgi:hypothetical protein
MRASVSALTITMNQLFFKCSQPCCFPRKSLATTFNAFPDSNSVILWQVIFWRARARRQQTLCAEYQGPNNVDRIRMLEKQRVDEAKKMQEAKAKIE